MCVAPHFLTICSLSLIFSVRACYLPQGWMLNSPNAQDAPNILAFIRKHNNIGLWAAAFVLEKHTAEERAKVNACTHYVVCSEGNKPECLPFRNTLAVESTTAIECEPRLLTVVPLYSTHLFYVSWSSVARRRSLGGLCKWQIPSGDWATTTVFLHCIVPSLATLSAG